jgi:hypothetical protein
MKTLFFRALTMFGLISLFAACQPAANTPDQPTPVIPKSKPVASPTVVTSTPTLTSTSTITPTDAPTQTPTPEFINYSIDNYTPTILFLDEFEIGIDETKWDSFVIPKKANKSKIDSSLTDGKLIVSIDAKNINQYYFYKLQEYKDVTIKLTTENIGINNNRISLICGENESNFYEFSISNGGKWEIQHYTTKKDYFSLTNGGENIINMGKRVNDISMTCTEHYIIFSVNGEQIDTPYLGYVNEVVEGFVGFGVSSREDEHVSVAVDRFSIEEPYSLLDLSSSSPENKAESYFTEEFNYDIKHWTFLKNSIYAEPIDPYLSLRNGKLVFDFNSYVLAILSYKPYSYEDVSISIKYQFVENKQDITSSKPTPTATPTDQSPSDSTIGIYCHSNEEDLYQFQVDSWGEYWIIRAHDNSPWAIHDPSKYNIEILAVGKAPIKRWEAHEIKAVCKENTLSLFINSDEIRTVEIKGNTREEGKIGFILAEGSPDYNIEIESITIARP